MSVVKPECQGFFYHDSMCLLFSKFKSATYYSSCEGCSCTSGCYAKLEDFEGTNLHPDPTKIVSSATSGKNKYSLKELVKNTDTNVCESMTSGCDVCTVCPKLPAPKSVTVNFPEAPTIIKDFAFLHRRGIDLKITQTQGTYDKSKPIINVLGNIRLNIEKCDPRDVSSFTFEFERLGAPVSIPELKMMFYDIDCGKKENGCETFTLKGYDELTPAENPNYRVIGDTITATAKGGNVPNPDNLDDLTDAQKAATVMYTFKGKTRFTLDLSCATRASGGRNFLTGFLPCK
jgi:hypothetical protein